jgi:hypothetical protein
MFEDFDFRVLDDPSFKEDAVREELIAPLLRRLGYLPSGRLKVVRSRALLHPFVMIGSKRYPINIIPDYTLLVDDEPLLVLDAKAPNEPIVKSHHVEQVFSYAIHPEVRCNTYSLCNGRDLVLYDVRRSGPIFRIPVADMDRRWAEVVRAFDPRTLRLPEIHNFKIDFGLYVLKVGVPTGASIAFTECFLQDLCKVNDDLLTASASMEVKGEDKYIVSFDFPAAVLEQILNPLPGEEVARIRSALRSQPFRVDLHGKVVVQLAGIVGELTQGPYEEFVPVVVTDVISSRFDPTVVLTDPEDLEGSG